MYGAPLAFASLCLIKQDMVYSKYDVLNSPEKAVPLTFAVCAACQWIEWAASLRGMTFSEKRITTANHL